MELPAALLSPSLKKIKKSSPKKFLIFLGMKLSSSTIKKFLIFRETKLSGSNIRKFLIFSQKEAFLIFRETETWKKFFIFQETELSYILGNENHKKTYVEGSNFSSSKSKKNPLFKKFLIFRGNGTF